MEDDVAGGVAGRVIDVERERADRDLIALVQPAIGLERHAANPVFAAVLVEPRDPEAILLVRPLDRHAEIVGERLRLAAMIDMAVGEQDLLDRDAMMRRSEEHTSELQSLLGRPYAVFCLKKKNPQT